MQFVCVVILNNTAQLVKIQMTRLVIYGCLALFKKLLIAKKMHLSTKGEFSGWGFRYRESEIAVAHVKCSQVPDFENNELILG